MRTGAVALVSAVLLALPAAPAGAAPPPLPLPALMADTGGGSQLITATAPGLRSTTGTVTWWDRRGGRWTAAGTAPARFGANGLVEGGVREQGTSTTPTGLYGLPYAFGTAPPPEGTRMPHRPVRDSSWWCQDNDSAAYNRWTDPRPDDCRPTEAERLADYRTQYAHALVVAFNYERPVRGRGAGIFLHVDGTGPTAGCVSVPRQAMADLLRWADPARRPHIAIGTATGATALYRY